MVTLERSSRSVVGKGRGSSSRRFESETRLETNSGPSHNRPGSQDTRQPADDSQPERRTYLLGDDLQRWPGMFDFSSAMEWLSSEPRSITWLGWFRLAANLTIVAAITSIVCTLYTLSRRHSSGLPAPRWLVALFALGVAICGLCHLGRAIGFGPPPDLRPGPTGMRIAIAIAWSFVAVKLPAVVTQLMEPIAAPHVCSGNHQSPAAVAEMASQLDDESIRNSNVVHNQPRRLGASDSVARLNDVLADRESDQCQS